MTQQMWLENLAAFSLQVAILIVAGTALVRIFRLRAPAVLLVFWQALLVVCLLLPAFQPWRQNLRSASVASQPGPPLASTPVVLEPNVTITAAAAKNLRMARYPLSASVPYVLACGAVLRLLWLLVGLMRLRRYVYRSRRPDALPEVIREMQRRVGVSPEIFISPDIDSPVTIGWHRPAVLLPESFTAMSAGMQRTIACHEFLHVERGDWLFIVIEELLRSLFWFHPAIRWALGRIHLSREQVVDHQVLRVTGTRGPYLESLLQIASLRGRPAAVPAPLLLREHHLVQRVALMMKESTMTRPRLIASLVAIAALLLWAGAYAIAWFPLTAPAAAAVKMQESAVSVAPTPAPAISTNPRPDVNPAVKRNPAAGTRSQEPASTGVKIQEPRLIYKVDPVYPELARRARIQQIMLLEVLVDAEGNVANIRVKRGHPLLDQAAIEAVKQWRFEPGHQNGRPVTAKADVEVAFMLDANALMPGTSNSNAVVAVRSGAPEAPPTPRWATGGAPPGTVSPDAASPQRTPLRVGGNVQESKIIKKVDPIYPEIAKQARVEQIVMLEVSVNEEGYVSNVRVIRGHPLLDQAAIDAVKQWVYAPTLLNGEKVPVVATVTVIFSLTSKFTLDSDGYIKDTKGAIVSVATLREIQGPIQITPSSQTSFEQIQQTLGYLQTQGVENVRLNSQTYIFAAGRLFYLAPGTFTAPMSQNATFATPVEVPRTAEQVAQFIRPPVLDVDWNQLAKLAESSGRLPSMNRGTAGAMALRYTVCVDEAGQIVAVQGPGGSLDVPEVTAALRAARVTTVGTRGNAPAPVALQFSLRVTLQ